jgi:glycosyltransferase involved in cell wall biosynthesis
MKTVYYEPAGRLQVFDKQFLFHPPDGYEFTTKRTSWDRAISPAVNNDRLFFLVNLNILRKTVPVHLVKAYLEKLKTIPGDVALTFSRNHLIFRNEPWVIHVEWPTSLAGFSYTYFRACKKIIERVLNSYWCKGILTWSEIAKESIERNLQLTSSEVHVVPLSVPAKDFVKSYDGRRIRLLFVGSANIPGEFELKGANVLLDAFIQLDRRYSNLELVIRSDVSADFRRKCQKHSNIKLIEGIVGWERLEEEFKKADIFLFPGHHTPFNTILDAMSYELPAIVTDVYGNPELVQNGKTGFLIQRSKAVPYFHSNLVPDGVSTKFKRAIRTPDEAVVRSFVEKAGLLIEDEKLRRSMGKAARWEVEEGRFSLTNRNIILKRVLDKATS